MKILAEDMSSISMKWYMTVGAILGGVKGFIESNGQDIATTFILGFIGAIGAGIAKLVLEKIVVRIKRKRAKKK